MSWPLLQQGLTGETVRTIQYLLNAQGSALTVDGDFGPATTDAVRTFQNNHGLGADGIVGDATWPVLTVNLQSGNSGDAVSAVQSQLNSRSGRLAVDGVFGAETTNAIQVFQSTIGLTADGSVSWYTWQALVNNYLTLHDAQQCAHSVYDAWANNDQVAAEYNAGPFALSGLFSRPWNAGGGWNFDKCGVATGNWACTWTNSSGTTLTLEGSYNPDVTLYIATLSAYFEP